MINAFATFCKAADRIYDAEDILRYIIENWTKYTDLLHSDYGVYKPAAVPTPGLIAAYPRAAVNLWLKAKDFALKCDVALPSTPMPPRECLPRAATAKPARKSPQWDTRPWEEVLPDSYEDDIYPAWSRDEAGIDAHAYHVMEVWKAHGSPIMKDFPKWAKDILSEKVPTFVDRLRELEERPAPPEPALLQVDAHVPCRADYGL